MKFPKSKRFRISLYAFHVCILAFLIGLKFDMEPVALASGITLITASTIGAYVAADTIRKSE